MIDLYVYYKVRAADTAPLAARVRALQQEIGDRFGVRAQLKRRPGARDGLQTWMEVYPGVDAAFEARLDELARQAGLAPWLAGPRHAEVFIDLEGGAPAAEPTPCA